MGWTSTNYSKYVHGNIAGFLKEELFGESMIDCASLNRGKENYVAFKAQDGKVYACVVLIHWYRGYYNCNYKDMDETMGPYYHRCPKRILETLSPLEDDGNQNAKEWRKKCWEYHNNKKEEQIDIHKGDIISIDRYCGSVYYVFKVTKNFVKTYSLMCIKDYENSCNNNMYKQFIIMRRDYIKEGRLLLKKKYATPETVAFALKGMFNPSLDCVATG